ncbi:MAG: D-alanyl-D-alanine carboxypeptidase, partial [Gammaproteobacteria bacterium]|nr:D-alanyl-D-alanine carboxypeptidase [Gammaproteobacteria bacterium]
NVMARQLLLTLGAETFGPPATLDKARKAAGEVLKREGLELPSLILDNGSGLSRVSRISAADLGRLLAHAGRGSRFPELAASLPIAGRDGTLTKTYSETPFGGRAHIKTGSLNGVSAIAGYVLADSGRRLAVVALLEHPLAAKGPGEEAHGQLLTAISRR